MENNFQELMMAKELEQITPEYSKLIVKGTLIGFKGLGEERGITAAYPVWKVVNNQICFVLFWSQETGRPCVDNTSFASSDLYINKEPIIVDIDVVNPITFGQNLALFFN